MEFKGKFLGKSSLALLFLGLNSTHAAQKGAPNILYIFTDDQSSRTVGAYKESYEWVETPNIDKLAEKGVLFESAYIGAWCMPSRATALTGKLPHAIESLKLRKLDYPKSTYDPKKTPFWPRVFRENGYTTAHIGKWHTGVDAGFGRDWDYQAVWNRPANKENAGNYYYDQLISFNGKKAVKVPGYSTDNYTKWAKEFIWNEGSKLRDKSKPWFLWLCYGGTHSPFTPEPEKMADYADIQVETPKDIFGPRLGKPKYMQKNHDWEKGPDGKPKMETNKTETAQTRGIYGSALQDWIRQYHQCAKSLDDAVGELMMTLRESGELDNTVVVFTSDQGLAMGQHGFADKFAPYDANLKAPLIMSRPGHIPEGKVVRDPVGGVDIIPTFFAMAGIDLPWKMHGNDLSPLLKEGDQHWAKPVLLTHTGAEFGSDTKHQPLLVKKVHGVPWWVMLVVGHHKYIRTLKRGEIEELYDLEKDPEELTNLALDPSYRTKVLELREQAIEELRKSDAPFVDHMPPVANP